MIFNKQNNMTPAKARLKLAVHAGETENFAGGYRYALKYGFCNLEDMIQKFDEIFICLKLLNETGRLAQIDRELLTQLSELLWGSVSYINSQKIHSRVVGIFAEVLSETLFFLLMPLIITKQIMTTYCPRQQKTSFRNREYPEKRKRRPIIMISCSMQARPYAETAGFQGLCHTAQGRRSSQPIRKRGRPLCRAAPLFIVYNPYSCFHDLYACAYSACPSPAPRAAVNRAVSSSAGA